MLRSVDQSTISSQVRTMHPFRWMFGLVAIAAIAAVAVSSGSSAFAGHRSAARDAVGAHPRDAVLQRLSVLRDSKGTAPSTEQLERLGGVMTRVPGSDPGSGRDIDARVARSDRDVSVLVGLGDDYACLVVRSPVSGTSSTGCTDLTTAADGARPLASVDLVRPRRWRVTAVMLDGVDTVVVTNSAGTRSLAVVNNIATALVPAGATRLEWTTADGAAHRLSVMAS
jgi:hypothetical protein